MVKDNEMPGSLMEQKLFSPPQWCSILYLMMQNQDKLYYYPNWGYFLTSLHTL